jgi:hypothetical protein
VLTLTVSSDGDPSPGVTIQGTDTAVVLSSHAQTTANEFVIHESHRLSCRLVGDHRAPEE